MKTTKYRGVFAYLTAASVIVMTAVVVVLNLSSGVVFSCYLSSTDWKPKLVNSIVRLQSIINLSRLHSDDNWFRSVISSDHYRSSTSSFPKLLSRKPTSITRRRRLEQELGRARAAIRRAASVGNVSLILQNADVLSSDIYRNPVEFYQSYIEMERRFKVYVYEEGELPMVHDGPCKNIYTTEGRFITEMEHGRHNFRTKHAHKAHVYFMPFSVAWMVKYLYKPDSRDITPLRHFLSDYVRLISTKHSFWNRTHAADHFMLSCHDWGPRTSKTNPNLYKNSIRVLCNANTSEGFNPQKDASLPEINLNNGNIPPKLLFPPPATTPRPHLAFFAGGVHGPIRPILLHYWMGQDPDIQVFQYLPKHLDYYALMLSSKYCLCPSGYEVASPRIVESVYSECVPVIISENYVLPFSDVLKWEAFSINVKVSDVSRLKEILIGVTDEEYLRLQENLRAVRRHFILNQPARRFDVFHMILHSVWLRRLNINLAE